MNRRIRKARKNSDYVRAMYYLWDNYYRIKKISNLMTKIDYLESSQRVEKYFSYRY